jgi:glycosyltransferase involved in cell wall biosynthesis
MNKKVKICMNSMVANEANTIIRMLESVYKYIDFWVIQDNGSKDGTQDIIKNFFKEKNIPGVLYETEWKFPGYNRDHTLQECLKTNHGCDWILRMDADETLEIDDDFDWSILEDTSIQSWNVNAVNGGTRYMRTWMWNAKLPWFFQHDVRHETIHLPDVGESFQRVSLPSSFKHRVSQDGQTWAAPRKFLRDALELEIDKVVGDKIKDDHYHLWYIGKSYLDCYGKPSELFFGKKHSDEYARRGIWYLERYMELVHEWTIENPIVKSPNEWAYFSMIIIAEAYFFMGNEEMGLKYLSVAEDFCAGRNEHLYTLAQFYEKNNMIEKAIEILNQMLSEERTNPYPKLVFLIDDRYYHDTSDFLYHRKEELEKKLSTPVINLESFSFQFS